MKFSIERAILLKALAQAQSVVERRNTIPILANVLIEAEGAQVSLRATDLDIEVVDKAPAMVERAGSTTVSAVMLHEIVRKLPDGALVSLTEDAATGRLTIAAGRSVFSLATLPREDFPVMASSEYTTNFSANAKVLRRLFDKAKFAISTEETRYYLNGVYMHIAKNAEGPTLRCVATDGHRLAQIDAPLPEGGGWHARRHRAAQDGRRVAQAFGRRRRADRGIGVRNQGALCDAGHSTDLKGHRRHVPGLYARHPHGQHAAAGSGRRRIRQGGGPGGHGVVGTLTRGETFAGRRPADPVGQRAGFRGLPRKNWPWPTLMSIWKLALMPSTCWK